MIILYVTKIWLFEWVVTKNWRICTKKDTIWSLALWNWTNGKKMVEKKTLNQSLHIFNVWSLKFDVLYLTFKILTFDIFEFFIEGAKGTELMRKALRLYEQGFKYLDEGCAIFISPDSSNKNHFSAINDFLLIHCILFLHNFNYLLCF